MNYNYYLRCFLLFLFLYPGINFSQEKESDETPETIIQRDLFIRERRAGGPGKILPDNVYTNAMEHKQNMVTASQLNDNVMANNWVNVNPNGMFYNLTGVNYISGRTNSIAFIPLNPNTIYIAAAEGGVWKTTNGGISWTALTEGLSSLASGSISVDPSNPNNLYYGTGELNFSLDSQYGDGIFKSTNAGLTWTKIATSATVGSYVSQLAINPINTQIIYAGTSNGLYKSTNAGSIWTRQGAFTYVMSIIIDPVNTQVIYTSSGNYSAGAINKSTDGGSTWTTLTNGLPASDKGRIQLAMAPSNNLIIYASIASSSSSSLLALSRTTDGGNNWTTMATSPNPLGGQGWYDNAIVVKPSDPNSVLVGGLDIYLSTNGGTTLVQKSYWYTSNSNQFSHADIHYLAYNGTVLYCGSDGGVYKSTNDGNNWTDLNAGLSTLQFQSADFDPTNILKMYGGCQDNDKETTTNGGTNWIQRTTGDGGYTIVDPVNTNYIYSQYIQGSLERSNNSGVSFTSIEPSGSSGGLFYNPFEMAPGDHNTIVYAQADVWKTTSVQTATTSSGWSSIASTTTIGGNVSAIGISAATTNKIYIGTDNGRILVTTNNGTNWSLSTGYPYVTDFAVDSLNDNICYASFGGAANNQVMKTTNKGGSWTNISTGLPNISANSIIIKTTAPRAVIVGMDAGVYYTTNEGATWVSYNTGLPNVTIYDLKYHMTGSGGIIMAVTHGRGCWTIGEATLPILLAFFNYAINENSVTLRWATQQEINNSGFDVERRKSGEAVSEWSKIGFIQGNGTTHETKYYSFKDEILSTGIYNYRLKQYDYNGNYELYNLTGAVTINPPEKFSLHQNYPNPFNPISKIKYQIAKSSLVNLTVFDVAGKEITTLVNEKQTPGFYEVTFEGNNLSSGIYYYQLKAEGFVETKKMVLLK